MITDIAVKISLGLRNSHFWNVLFNTRQHGSSSTLDQPLLSRDEILELMYKSKQGLQNPTKQQEIAHRLRGDSHSIFKGSGLDYEESRPYQAGDEPRFINWRLTARSATPYVKIFREERRKGVFILVDRRSSMLYGTKTRLKVTQAARVATIAAFLARQQNLMYGGAILQDKLSWINECFDDQGAFHLAHRVSGPCPPRRLAEQELSLHHTLKVLINTLVMGTTVYLISDFSDLDTNNRALLFQLSRLHQVKAIHIVDKSERQLPSAGKLNLCLPNNADTWQVNTSDKNIRATYNRLAEKHIMAIQRMFNALGINYLRIDTDDDPIESGLLYL